MTTQPRTRRLLHRATLVGSGVVAGAIALTVTLVSTISHSDAATTSTTSTTTTTNDDTSKNSSTSDGGGLSSDDQTQAPVGGSNGS